MAPLRCTLSPQALKRTTLQYPSNEGLSLSPRVVDPRDMTNNTLDHEGWKKAHSLLFSMALRHELTPSEYVEACRYWDELYAGYRDGLED